MTSRRGQDSQDPDDEVDDQEEDPDDPVDMVEFQKWLDSKALDSKPESSEVAPSSSSAITSPSGTMTPPSMVPKHCGGLKSNINSISNHEIGTLFIFWLIL